MDVKQVIVLRKDLNMRKGKMVAQGAHASLEAIFNNLMVYGETYTIPRGECLDAWLDMKNGFKKICVSVNSEQELLDVYEKAKETGHFCSLVKDLGHTEFNGVPTYTAVAIGPAPSDEIDLITKDLPLL